MKTPSRITVATAAMLVLCLTLPPSASALRVSAPQEDSKRQSGLEEALISAAGSSTEFTAGLEEREQWLRDLEGGTAGERQIAAIEIQERWEADEENFLKEWSDHSNRLIRALVANLKHLDWNVRSDMLELLAALASHAIFHASMLENGVVPAAFANLKHPNGYVISAAQRLLITLASHDVFRRQMKASGLTPKALGYSTGLDWAGVGRLEGVNRALASMPGYADLSLGGRALLRRKLSRRAGTALASLRRMGESWLAHAVRLEGLDRLGGLASAGAELHLPVGVDVVGLERLADHLAGGIGFHAMVPWISEGQSRQIDLRLLPAYPSLFRRLLAELLGDAALAGQAEVGAHYSLGLDLGKELVPVALALYYGDENYLEAPVAGSAEGGVGFPGVWTYRGQSNLHLRPLRTLVRSISVDLFQSDVDRLNWLASAAAAAEGTPQREVYEEFLKGWERWVQDQGGVELMETVRAAEREVGAKTGTRVSPALDKASADLLTAVYRAPRYGEEPRRALAILLRETQEKLEVTAWGSASAARAIQSYRESESLEAMERTFRAAVKAVEQEIFSEKKEPPQEVRLLRTLEALDPEQAQRVRTSLSPPAAGGSTELPAGLEEDAEQQERPGIIAAGLEDPRGLPLGVALSRTKDESGRFLPVVYVARSEEQAAGLEELGVERASIFVLGPDLPLKAALTAAEDWLRLMAGVERVVELGVREKIPGILEWLLQYFPGIALSPQMAGGLEEWVEGAAELLGNA